MISAGSVLLAGALAILELALGGSDSDRPAKGSREEWAESPEGQKEIAESLQAQQDNRYANCAEPDFFERFHTGAYYH